MISSLIWVSIIHVYHIRDILCIVFSFGEYVPSHQCIFFSNLETEEHLNFQLQMTENQMLSFNYKQG